MIVQVPALTYRIEESYFRNNLLDQAGDYNPPADGYYNRTIPQSELTLEFGVNNNDVDGEYKIYHIAYIRGDSMILTFH